jgi:hypothetical protein
MEADASQLTQFQAKKTTNLQEKKKEGWMLTAC